MASDRFRTIAADEVNSLLLQRRRNRRLFHCSLLLLIHFRRAAEQLLNPAAESRRATVEKILTIECSGRFGTPVRVVFLKQTFTDGVGGCSERRPIGGRCCRRVGTSRRIRLAEPSLTGSISR
jgi:hypothetical protein